MSVIYHNHLFTRNHIFMSSEFAIISSSDGTMLVLINSYCKLVHKKKSRVVFCVPRYRHNIFTRTLCSNISTFIILIMYLLKALKMPCIKLNIFVQVPTREIQYEWIIYKLKIPLDQDFDEILISIQNSCNIKIYNAMFKATLILIYDSLFSFFFLFIIRIICHNILDSVNVWNKDKHKVIFPYNEYFV